MNQRRPDILVALLLVGAGIGLVLLSWLHRPAPRITKVCRATPEHSCWCDGTERLEVRADGLVACWSER